MNNNPLSDNSDLIAKLDATEREYAPEELAPGDPARTRAALDADEDAGSRGYDMNEPPSAAPVASVGSSSSSSAAPPNIGQVDHGGAPGDPETQAADPFSTNDKSGRDL